MTKPIYAFSAFWYTVWVLVIFGCKEPEPKTAVSTPTSNFFTTEQDNLGKIIGKSTQESWRDSLLHAVVDTSSIEGKSRHILNIFAAQNCPPFPHFDTLVDITYDGFDDYILGYYGISGTGLKNLSEVYIYDPKLGTLIKQEELSNIANITFFIDQKLITGFYIGMGAGDCSQFEWIDNCWMITRSITVDNEEESTKWISNYPLTGKSDTIFHHYQMVPPDIVLKTGYRLP